tara:strand:- start:174 stop:548 length:375 start_codon:yes stop_codon:yes gene_type:complete
LKNNDLKIRKELETVYIDSSGSKHLDYMKALCAESQIATCREREQQQKQRIMNIVELIMRVLEDENWGVYYRNKPLQSLEVKDGSSLYQVNQVDEDQIETVIEKALAWEHSQKNSNQNKNSMTG